MKHVTITAVSFLLAITQGSAEFQCPSATFVELGKDVLIDCLISDVNDIYWLRGTEEDHYPIVKIEMGLKTISKVAQDHFDITDSGALVIRNASNDLTGSYVMLHYRTNHVKEVDTVTLNVTKLIDSIIIEGPSGGAYPVGSNVTLSCTFQKGYVVGWKEFENKDIFVADTKVTANTKYDNFRVSLSDGISSLLIIGADLEDAGDYSCNTKSYAHVEIEAPPSLEIVFNVTDDQGTDSTDSHGVIDITCIARNARPAVMIRFKTNGSEWIQPSETWTVSNGVTFDTSATLKYYFQKNQTDVLLTCHTFGQTSISATEKTIHLYLPRCNITISANEVRCTCQANPPVHKYRMEINENLQDGDVLYIEDSNSANITCFGTNVMGTGLSSLQFPGDKAEAGFGLLSIVVTISVAAVLIVLAVIYIKRRFSSRGEISDEEQPNKEETNELLPKPGAISHEEKLPEDMKDIFTEFQQYKVEVSAITSSEWDLFAIDALGLEVTDVLEIINRKPPIKDQVSEVWRLWENHDDSKNTKEKLIETIKKNSKDFASILNLNDDHSNNTAGMTSGQQQVDDSTAKDLPQQDHCIMNKLLSEFITICGVLFGIVGAKQMHRCYFPSKKVLLREAKQTPLSPGVAFLNYLIDNGKLIPTYHSFDFLASTLSACNLHRASFALRTCLTETGLFKYKEEWLTFASSSINQDWEIFGHEQLGLTDNEMLNIIKVTDDLQKQVRLAFEKWVEKSKLKNNVTSKQLIEVLSKSKPYDIHATNLGGTGADFKPTLTSPFSVVLLALDHLIGNEGRTRLFRSYSKTQECKRNLFEYLIQTGRLEDNQPMLTTLRKKLKECHLLRAWKRLYLYTKSRTYTNLLSNISYGMECDWELFAMKDLNLGEEEVRDIITREKTVEAQIRNALDLWSTKNKCNEYELLFKIVVNSPVCKDTKHNSCWRKLSGDQGVNTESAVDDQHTKERNCERSHNPDDAFREMIQSVSAMIGNTGAFYLLQNYTDACDQNEVKEKDDRFQNKEFDGEILIKYLIERGRLSDNTESLETFRIRLTESKLFRVRNKLDGYISQRQNKESNDDQFMDPNSSNV